MASTASTSLAAGQLVQSVGAQANSAVSGATTAQARAAIGTAMAATVTGDQSVAVMVCDPVAAGVNTLLAAPANSAIKAGVRPRRRRSSRSANLPARPGASSSGAETETSDVTVSIDPSKLAVPGDLLVGLFGGTVIGAGFSKLSFEIDRGTTVLDTQNFTTAAAAKTYFTDDELNLGSVMTGLTSSGLLDLTFKLSVTEASAGAGFSFGLLVGDPPAEPPIFAPIGHGG